MVWTKIPDAFPRDPKIVGLTDAAFRAHVTVLCYCGEQLTNGEVALAAIKVLGIRPKAMKDLVSAGLYDEVTDDDDKLVGWLVRDYLLNQPSREEVEERR